MRKLQPCLQAARNGDFRGSVGVVNPHYPVSGWHWIAYGIVAGGESSVSREVHDYVRSPNVARIWAQMRSAFGTEGSRFREQGRSGVAAKLQANVFLWTMPACDVNLHQLLL